MGDMLSQAEIDALLNGSSISEEVHNEKVVDALSTQEIDALGEIGNISMGTSATTLYTLLGHKVMITTPQVVITTWGELAKQYSEPYVAVRVEYTAGLIGSNLLVLKEDDVKIITDLMMGGEGTNIIGEMTDLHLSAISEAMNQMVGSSSTSMSSMFSKRIDISPPKAFVLQFDPQQPHDDFTSEETIVKISFKMEVGELLDSEIMQILPLSFAKSLVENLLSIDISTTQTSAPKQETKHETKQQSIPQQEWSNQQTQNDWPSQQSQMGYPPPSQQPYQQPNSQQGYGQGFGQGYPQGYPMGYEQPPMQGWNQPHGYGMNQGPQYNSQVNVQPANFESFDEVTTAFEKKNISLIMDVPLQVTVELGRTQRKIKDILEMGPGSIIELDKLAGEPVDILVNGKPVAKGEVVVIDESFGVRITDIIHPAKRL